MMRGAFLRLVVALAIVLGLSTARTALAQLLSPGPLSRSHASLEGDQHCGDCHPSGKRVDQGACLKCHGDIGGRIAAGAGMHGTVWRGACEGCHVEHVGGGPPTRWPGGGPNNLDHAQTGWPLDGAHKTQCNKCHNKSNARGAPTFLGLSKACASCHKDPHDGRFGTACASCHGESAWKDLSEAGLKGFDHDSARFQLRGAHTSVACAKCHFEPPKWTGLKFGACIDCHKDPHAGRLGNGCTDCHEDTKWKPVSFKHIGAKHPGVSLGNGHAAVQCQTCHDKGNLAAPSRGTQCVSCHKAVHKAPLGTACAGCHGSIQWLGLPRSIGLAAHVKTDYPLSGKHDEVACAGCHKPTLPKDERYRKLAFGRCVDCHQDRHAGEFASADGGECKKCHSVAGFRPTLFGTEAHAATRFALVGKHTASPCSACHTSARPLLDLHVAKQACADCHANPHGDQFAAEMAKGGCGHCHEPTGWNLPKIDHSTWPLTGAHATAACNSCHHPSAEDRKAGHGASYRGVPRQCSGCHDDAHLGQFRLTQPASSATSATRPGASKSPPSITRDGVGPHRGAREGRVREVPPDGGRRRRPHHGPVARAVDGVHLLSRQSPRAARPARGDPAPGAALLQAGRRSFTSAVSCSACHSTTAWKSKDAAGGGVKFDHATTGFPLTGQHMNASCVSCHNSTVQLKRACASCHEDFHRGRLAQACDDCHVPAGWKVTRPLQIHRMTQFPLTGMHVLADCTQCHLRASEQKFTDAPVECYGCHQQDYQRPGIFPHTGSATMAPLPRDCTLCHRAVAWVPANVPASARDHHHEPAPDPVRAAAGPRSPVPHQLRLAPPRRVQRLPHVAVGPALGPLRRVPRARSRAPHAAAQAPHGDRRRVLHVVPPRGGAAMRRALGMAWLAGALSLVASTADARARRPAPPAAPPEPKPAAPATSVEVTVVDVAGTKAYLQPGAQGSVRRNATVQLKGKEYRVLQASASYAVIEIRQRSGAREGQGALFDRPRGGGQSARAAPAPAPLDVGARVDPRARPRGRAGAAYVPTRRRGARSPLRRDALARGRWPRPARQPARGQPRLHGAPRARPRRALRGAGRARLRRLGAAVGRVRFCSRVGGTTRSVLVVRELQASYGSGGWFAGLGRMKYAASTLGTLDGARTQAPLGAGFSVGAFGGFLPNPLGGEVRSRRSGSASRRATAGPTSTSTPRPPSSPTAPPSAGPSTSGAVGHVRRLPGPVAGRRPLRGVRLRRGQPVGRQPRRGHGGRARSVRAHRRLRARRRLDLLQPERSRWLASFLPSSWFCRTVPAAGGASTVASPATAGARRAASAR